MNNGTRVRDPLELAHDCSAIADLVSEGGYALASDDSPEAGPARDLKPDLNHRSRLMSEHSIRFDGLHYLLDGSRYERLADALACARSVTRFAPRNGCGGHSTLGE